MIDPDSDIFRTPGGSVRFGRLIEPLIPPKPRPKERAMPPRRPRTIRLCVADRLLGALLAVISTVTLAVVGWTLLKVVDLGERVAALEASRANATNTDHRRE